MPDLILQCARVQDAHARYARPLVKRVKGGVGLAVVRMLLVRSIWTLTTQDGAPVLSSFRAREPPSSLADCHVGFMSLYFF